MTLPMTQLACRDLERRMGKLNHRIRELRTPEYATAPELYPHVTERIEHVTAESDRLLDEWKRLNAHLTPTP